MKNNRNRKTTEQFIKESNIIHGNKYIYDKCTYLNAHEKVIITCKKHGDFHCKPNNHINGAICKKCSIEKSYLTTESFIEKVKNIHGDRYTFDNTEYKHSNKGVSITCRKHGNFVITPNKILSGRGCQKCSEQKLSYNQFVDKSILVHGYLYSYEKSIYKNSVTPVEIICSIHGSFWQTPSDHISSKSNCPSCVVGGFKRTEPGYFYVQSLQLDGKLVSYKFGITNKSPTQRMKQHKSNSIYTHNIIFSIFNNDGNFIHQLEKYIIRNIDCSFILKENMKDGYTETINPDDIDILENLIVEYLSK